MTRSGYQLTLSDAIADCPLFHLLRVCPTPLPTPRLLRITFAPSASTLHSTPLAIPSGSGSVDFQEFVGGLSAFSSKGGRDEKLRFAFKVYDMDRDGYISNGELYLVLKQMVGNNLKVSEGGTRGGEVGRWLCGWGCGSLETALFFMLKLVPLHLLSAHPRCWVAGALPSDSQLSGATGYHLPKPFLLGWRVRLASQTPDTLCPASFMS